MSLEDDNGYCIIIPIVGCGAYHLFLLKMAVGRHYCGQACRCQDWGDEESPSAVSLVADILLNTVPIFYRWAGQCHCCQHYWYNYPHRFYSSVLLSSFILRLRLGGRRRGGRCCHPRGCCRCGVPRIIFLIPFQPLMCLVPQVSDHGTAQ